MIAGRGLLIAAALAAGAAGALTTGRALRAVREADARLDRRRQALAAVQDLERQEARLIAARRLVEASGAPADLEAVAVAANAAERGSLRPREDRDLGDGWRAVVWEIEWPQVALTSGAAAVQAATAAKPPWRVVEWQVEARDADGREGRMKVALETVRRATAGGAP
jgi:hypothetical protein